LFFIHPAKCVKSPFFLSPRGRCRRKEEERERCPPRSVCFFVSSFASPLKAHPNTAAFFFFDPWADFLSSFPSLSLFFFPSLQAIAQLHNSELQGRSIIVRLERAGGASKAGPGGGGGGGGGGGANAGRPEASSGLQIVVRNLPWSTTSEDLRQVFQQAGLRTQ
jgi:hypothetical protein